MTANKKPMRRAWRDRDDAPDLSSKKWRQRFEGADVMAGKKVVQRGRPPADVMEYFRSMPRGNHDT